MFSKFAMLLATSLLAFNAHASEYYFSQSGFDNGGTITGTLDATDLNNNGLISGSVLSNFNEISNFSLSFSGNSLVPAFTETLADLSVLNYQTSRSVLGDENPEGIAVNWFGDTGYTYVTGVAVNGQQGGDIIDWSTGLSTHSDNLVIVTPAVVPLPGSAGLFSAAFLAGVARMRFKA